MQQEAVHAAHLSLLLWRNDSAEQKLCDQHPSFDLSEPVPIPIPLASQAVDPACPGGKAAPPLAVPPKQPKAALQQHCQSGNLAQPQFSRLAPGGGRQEAVSGLQTTAAAAVAAAAAAAAALAKAAEAGTATAADTAEAAALRLASDKAAAAAAAAGDPPAGLVRYSVTVAAAASAGRKGGGGHGGAGRRGAPAPPRCFQLPEPADGWATINVSANHKRTWLFVYLVCACCSPAPVYADAD